MNDLVIWCNSNSGFLSAMFAMLTFVTTFVYVIATWKILGANNKSAKMAENQILESKESLQKTIDMQLWDKRLLIANNIENNIYSNTIMEYHLLFSKKISDKINEIKIFQSKVVELNHDLEIYNYVMIETIKNDGLYDVYLNIEADSCHELATKETIKEYKEFMKPYAEFYYSESGRKDDYKNYNPTLINLKITEIGRAHV